jgi:hypothetical protein
MNGAEGSIKHPPGTPLSSSAQRSRRPILAALLLAPFLCITLWELGHRIKFGDFFGYGYHADLVEDHSNIGVPRLHTSHCLRVTNYTLSSLKFEGHQWPMGGTTDGGITYHDRIERWNQESHSWSTISDFGDGTDPSAGHANIVRNVRPGQSIHPTGCYELATVEGIHKGDVVRLVAFTSYSTSSRVPGQLAFYSPPFTVNEESPKNAQKSASGATAALPDSTTTRRPAGTIPQPNKRSWATNLPAKNATRSEL